MSVDTDLVAAPAGSLSLRETSLWAGAGAVVLAAHLLLAYAYYATAPEEPSAQVEEQALKIDLAPISMSQPASVAAEQAPPVDEPETLDPVEQSQPLAPDTVQPLTPEPVTPPEQPETIAPADQQPIEPETAAPVEAEPIEPQPRETTEALEPSELAALPPTPPEEMVQPETITPSDPDAVVLPTEDAPTPTPRPEPPKRTVEKPERKSTPAPTREVRERPTQRRAAKPQQQPSSQGGRSTAPRISPARWQSKVVAWLNRHKRYPSAARSRGEEGTADVAFTIDSSGRVLSVRIARSSGSSMLDQAALDMVRRSSPVPAPPPQIARSSISLGVPVNFQIR